MKLPLTPPDVSKLLESVDRAKLRSVLGTSPLIKGEYEPWDKVRHLEPPEGLTSEEWWLGMKMARRQLLKPIPLANTTGSPFRFGMPDPVLRLTHEIDQLASGRIQISEEVTNPHTRDRYIINSLIEESITSSQLEGASTTSEVARNMLRTGRKPIDRSEQMILNNYNAMRLVREHAGNALTPAFVFHLHRVVTTDTLDDPGKAGTFRAAEDNIQVEDEIGTALHRPPHPDELSQRLDLMCRFANDRPEDAFLHPVLRAIILHFWVGYDHPFIDGNGRTARALFYWSLLSQGYWLAEYISISRILKNARAQYTRSFLYTETDDNDLTYFLSYHLKVVRRAIADLQQYLGKKIAEVREVESLLRQSTEFNYRQLALLSHALRHPGTRYTIESHRRSHNVVYDTARTDLLRLAESDLLIKRKRGRTYEFTAPTDLGARLASKDVQ
jgi:Fic family protein